MGKGSECSVCAWERGSGIKVDTSRPKTKWAEEAGVSEAAIRRHLKHPPAGRPVSSGSDYKESWKGDEGEIEVVLSEKISNEAILRKFGHDPEQVSIVGVLEETHWQMAGEWQHRYRFKTSRKAKRDVKELLTLIDSWEYIPAARSSAPFTFVICPSDMQLAKTDWGGGSADTIDRVLSSYNAAADIVKQLRPERIIIAELGDSIENIYSTSSQRGTNDLAITEQIRVARRLGIEGVKALLPHTERLTYASVPSNHGSVRIGQKSPENHVLDDYGIEIAEQLRDVFSEASWGDRCDVVIPEFNYESLVIETSGTKIGMAHGHQARNADKLGEWWRGQSHGRMPLAEADIALFGHFHSFRVQQSGDARWLFVSPAQDNGSSWFTNATGERSRTGMLSFTTANGEWDNLAIL